MTDVRGNELTLFGYVMEPGKRSMDYLPGAFRILKVRL